MWNFTFGLLPGILIRANIAWLNDFYLLFARRAYAENEAARQITSIDTRLKTW